MIIATLVAEWSWLSTTGHCHCCWRHYWERRVGFPREEFRGARQSSQEGEWNVEWQAAILTDACAQQLLSSYSELERDIKKHQMLLESKSKRIKELETLLKQTREAADNEYQQLQREKEQIRTSLTARLREIESKIHTRNIYI